MLIAPPLSTKPCTPTSSSKERLTSRTQKSVSVFPHMPTDSTTRRLLDATEVTPHQQTSRTYPKLRPTKGTATTKAKPATTAYTLVPFIVDAHPAFLIFAVPPLHSFHSPLLLIERVRVTTKTEAHMVMVVTSMRRIFERRHPSPPFEYLC